MTSIKAIPTKLNGINFKSRLEARFYEWLSDRGVSADYEPSGFESDNGYIPDFYLDPWRLYVEVKPINLVGELRIFDNEHNGITFSNSKWICVDKKDRSDWQIIACNLSFSSEISFKLPAKFEVSANGGEFSLIFRIYSEWVELDPYL